MTSSADQWSKSRYSESEWARGRGTEVQVTPASASPPTASTICCAPCGAGRRDARPLRGRDRHLHHARLSLPSDGRAVHQLPPAALDAADASLRLRRSRAHSPSLCARHCRRLPLLFLWRRHVSRKLRLRDSHERPGDIPASARRFFHSRYSARRAPGYWVRNRERFAFAVRPSKSTRWLSPRVSPNLR